MKTRNWVFTGLKFVAGVIFIGLSIDVGALIVNFIFSLFNPEIVKNLYHNLDLSEMYENSKPVFFGMYGLILAIAVLKAHLFYIVVVLVTKIDLSKPFNNFVSKQIYRISYFTLAIGLLSYIARQWAKYLKHNGFFIDQLNKFWTDSQAFILMAAVIYIIAIIFSKGVEYQEEIEETV